jgi:aryl-alcohol dehydrogenase-like predicted oxidoreductase
LTTSETIIGNWLKQGGRRDKVIIATKVGMEMNPDRNSLSKARIQKWWCFLAAISCGAQLPRHNVSSRQRSVSNTAV